MNKVWVVAKNELARYFSSPLAYVYLVSFLLLNGSFAIYFGHFLTGEALICHRCLRISRGFICCLFPGFPCACGRRSFAAKPWCRL